MLTSKKQQTISAFFSSQGSSAGGSGVNGKKPSRAPLSAGAGDALSPTQSGERERKHGLENDENCRHDDDSSDVPAATQPLKKKRRVRKQAESGQPLQDSVSAQTESGSTLPLCDSSPAAPALGKSKSKGAVSERTAKYLFVESSPAAAAGSSSPPPLPNDAGLDDERERRRKESLHQRFVQKLGQPNALQGRKRRGKEASTPLADEDANDDDGDADDAGGGDGGGDDDDDDDGEGAGGGAAAKKKPARRGVAAPSKRGGGASKLTPLEKQVLEIKRSHMDTLLIVEVGYKFRFFGEDARVAARELNIMCIPGKLRYDEHPSEAHWDRFASASVPVHRLHVHVKRLVDAGHKVGVVRQLETAALKAAGDNRNAPFVRKLTNLYTKGTYIDDVDDPSLGGADAQATPTGYLLCITESNAKGWGTDEKVHIGILAVQPATGDVIYDDFEDGFMRTDLEARLLHIAPCELLIVGKLSKATEKILEHLSRSSSNVFGDKIRVERVDKPKTMAAQAYNHISTFYASKAKGSAREGTTRAAASSLLDKVLQLPEHVTVCLSAMIRHLTEFGLEHVFDLVTYFQPFSARAHMLLNGNTLASLEIYKNQTDFSARGSLFWCLDRTRTRFGQRLLRKWVGRPLLDRARLEERVAAVDELKHGSGSAKVERIRNLLSKIKVDLEKGLIRIYYGKCTRPELLNVLQALQRIANEFAFVRQPADSGFASPIVTRALAALPTIADAVVGFLDKINADAARRDDKYAFFHEEHETEAIAEHNMGIASVEYELDAHRAAAATTLRRRRVDYVTVAGIEYLIEVENAQLKHVPASWAKISGTRRVSRFHTPEVARLLREREQRKEALAAACDAAFAALLADVAARYAPLRESVRALAELDCLVALAEVAARPGYVRAEYMDAPGILVRAGRHPMVEQLLLDAYVPNGIALASPLAADDDSDHGDVGSSGGGGGSADDGNDDAWRDIRRKAARALLVTGPNMGGKSSYVRQVALIAIMGQVGSHVPAAAARLGLLDAVFTRMGALDNLLAGESTFMVELSETSELLKQATPRSLVILDELGRGTSTHDGVAIAHAVLDYAVRRLRCLLLFITHYQTLSGMAGGGGAGASGSSGSSGSGGAGYDGALKNVHMRFSEGGGPAGDDITFLYELGDGVAHRSYGLNVARLANLPRSVLDVAAVKSKWLEERVRARQLTSLSRLLASVISAADASAPAPPSAPTTGNKDNDNDANEGEDDDLLTRLITGVQQL